MTLLVPLPLEQDHDLTGLGLEAENGLPALNSEAIRLVLELGQVPGIEGSVAVDLPPARVPFRHDPNIHRKVEMSAPQLKWKVVQNGQ